MTEVPFPSGPDTPPAATSTLPSSWSPKRPADTGAKTSSTGSSGPASTALTSASTPSPARHYPSPPASPQSPLSVTDGGHSIYLRELGRRGRHPHGHLEAADNGATTFTDGRPERIATVESAFGQRLGKAIEAILRGDRCTAEAPSEADDWLHAEPARVSLAQAGINSVLLASGYRLDFGSWTCPWLMGGDIR